MNEEDNKKDQGGAQSQQGDDAGQASQKPPQPPQPQPPQGGPQPPQGGPQPPQGGPQPPQPQPPQGGTQPPQGGPQPPQGGPQPPQGGTQPPQPPQGGPQPPQGMPQPPQPPQPPQGMPSQGMPQPPQGTPPQGMPQPPQPPPEDTTPANFQLGTKLPPELKVKAPENNLSFDEDYFIRLLAGSISLSKDEKKRIVESIPKLRQAQIDELIRIFEEEKQKFAQLSQKHVPQLEKLAQQHYLEWMELEDEVEKAKKQKEDESKADEIRKNLGL